MAENKKDAEVTKTESTSKDSKYTLKVIGPDHKSSAQVLGFTTDKSEYVEFVPGQYISVGKGGQLTKAEATRLQKSTTWNFERVSE